jgi:hypothetical protein
MTYQEYLTHMKICTYMGTEPRGIFSELHRLVTELYDGLEILPYGINCIIIHTNGKYFFNINLEWNILYFNKEKIYTSGFSELMGWEDSCNFLLLSFNERFNTNNLAIIPADDFTINIFENNFHTLLKHEQSK